MSFFNEEEERAIVEKYPGMAIASKRMRYAAMAEDELKTAMRGDPKVAVLPHAQMALAWAMLYLASTFDHKPDDEMSEVKLLLARTAQMLRDFHRCEADDHGKPCYVCGFLDGSGEA